MSVLNLNQANKLYFGSIEAQKLYRGSELLYPVPVIDPFLNQVLLHLRGDNFTDSSPNPKTVNTSPSSAISTAIRKYGTGSLDFRALNSFLSIPNHAGLNDWGGRTIEFWYYPVSLSSSTSGLWQPSSTRNTAFSDQTGRFTNSLRHFSSTQILLNRFTLNTWHHLAFVVNNAQTQVYLNGILTESITRTLPSFSNSSFLVGGNFYGTTQNKGDAYFDSFRITNAVRYTQNFNPETDTFLAY